MHICRTCDFTFEEAASSVALGAPSLLLEASRRAPPRALRSMVRLALAALVLLSIHTGLLICVLALTRIMCSHLRTLILSQVGQSAPQEERCSG